MKTKSPPRFEICLLISLLLLASCKKENTTTVTELAQEELAAVSAQAESVSETVFNSILDIVRGVDTVIDGIGSNIFLPGILSDTVKCYSLQASHLTTGKFFPVEVILDYGTGCAGSDGRIRSGKLIIEYSNRLTLSGSSASTRFENFIIDGLEIRGNHMVTNKNTTTARIWETSTSAMVITSNHDFTDWHCERIITQIEGARTTSGYDNTYAITGSSNSVTKRGNRLFQASSVISKPLLKKMNCRWIMEGTVMIRKGNLNIATLDWGSGQCDDRASFAVLGGLREITLR